jgi:hypothetical protein
LKLAALTGRTAQRLSDTVVENSYEVKRVIAAETAAILIVMQQNYAAELRAPSR